MSKVIWDPAGHDSKLAAACSDLRFGIIGAAREVLADTREQRDYTRRGYASALMASVALSSNVIDQWAKENRGDCDAMLLLARVAAIRALKVYDEAPAHAREYIARADRACTHAIRLADSRAERDPTAWVALLSLHRTPYFAPQLPTETRFPELGSLPGPWGVLEQIWRRDRYNREAGHRLVDHFSPRRGGRNTHAVRVAALAAHGAPRGHPIKLLPLAAEVDYDPTQPQASMEQAEHYTNITGLRELLGGIDSAGLAEDRERLERAIAAGIDNARSLHLSALVSIAVGLFESWFPAGRAAAVPSGVPISDLSLLAHFLRAGGETGNAGRVLRYIAPYASRYPWTRLGDPETVLAKIHDECRVPFPPQHSD